MHGVSCAIAGRAGAAFGFLRLQSDTAESTLIAATLVFKAWMHYAKLCMSMRFGNALYSAEEGGQAAGEPGRKDLAPVIARGQVQITTTGLVPAGQSRLWYYRSLRSTRPGAVMLDTSRSSPGSVAA